MFNRHFTKPYTADQIKFLLVHAMTAFDRKEREKAQKKPRGYHNPYALGIYLGRLDDIMEDIKAGATVRSAILAGLTPGPLLNACLREVAEPKWTEADRLTNRSGLYYVKASERSAQ